MKTQVVSFHYTLKDKTGQTIEESQKSAPVMYLEGSGQIIPGLEAAMKQLKVGDKKEIFVVSDQAYGPRDPNLIVTLPHSQLPKGDKIEVGQQFRGESGDGHNQIFTVVEVTGTDVKMDGNHPLSGQDLTFNVEVLEKREATEEELQHGHAHGADGHHHH
ncbi:MAG: peptidylprolyl isomerase [Oligoflexia bacterium]|nr:peptidylprolyl isomerase [Oligoflexia bacterium]